MTNPRGSLKIRRHFERDVAAQTPADETRLVKAERVNNRPNRASMAGKGISARILRVIRLAMARKIDRDQPEALPQRSIELPREDT